MSRRAAFIPLAWILIACQSLTALVGSHGLRLCREADGPAHVEWVWADCCASDVADQISAADETPRLCSSNTCIDGPIGSHLSLHCARAASLQQFRSVVFRLHPLSANTDVRLQCVTAYSSMARRTAAGPPDPAQRALRSTVLRL